MGRKATPSEKGRVAKDHLEAIGGEQESAEEPDTHYED
jgi:hypothetical protein